MRVVRVGGRYLAGREQRLWIGLGVAAMAPVAGALYGSVIGAAATGIAAAVIAPELVRRLVSVRKGRLGERLITELLGKLPDDYCLINDVSLGRRRGNVDHVLIGPCGVVVIETKRWAGEISCNGDDWYVNGRKCHSVSRQANAGAAAIRELLLQRNAGQAGSSFRFIESIAVFTHPTCRLRLNGSRTIAARYSELLSIVLELAKRNKTPPEVVRRLADSLGRQQDQPGRS